MDPYVADPHWHEFILWYFYLGGIAAGANAVASLATLFGDEDDRRATRAADYLAFPLVCVCGILLIVDLGRPERFWHMLIQSQTFRPMFKWWSPMSYGSWILSAFGAFSFVAYAGVLVEDGWIRAGRWSSGLVEMRRAWPGKALAIGSAISAFFLGSYTGTLLSATNQPIWSNTTWLSPLFLASALSTGLAALVVGIRWRLRDVDPAALARLERLDGGAIALELAMLAAFAVSLGSFAGPAFGRWPGLLIPAFVVPIGLLFPIALRCFAKERAEPASSCLVLFGGFALRFAILGMPGPFLVTVH